jgi:hypothetical protein
MASGHGIIVNDFAENFAQMLADHVKDYYSDEADSAVTASVAQRARSEVDAAVTNCTFYLILTR